MRDPKSRSLGFGLSVFPVLLLLVAALVGALSAVRPKNSFKPISLRGPAYQTLGHCPADPRLPSDMLDRFAAILLDVNSTFMFGEDRYGPEHDYFATYALLGGSTLDQARVREAIDACITYMKPIYLDPEKCDSFPHVGEVLAALPETRKHPDSERHLLEQVIAAHEVGRVPPQYANALQTLARTHRLGIVSNIWSKKDLYILEFQRVQVLNLFDVIVFSSDGPSMKPSRRLFYQATTGLGMSPSDVVFVGDSLRCDVGGAAGIGMATVWIDRHGSGVPPDGPQPDYVVADLLELFTGPAPPRRVA